MNKFVTLAVAGGALLMAQSPTQAAPFSVPIAYEGDSLAQKVDYRRCSWRGGERRCAWVRSGPRVYGYNYGRPRAEAYRTGSTSWWRAMDYEGRGGHGRR